jgi:hypothetical protein
MTMAVNLNHSQKFKSFLANAREAYGDALPDWVEVLAKEADRTSGAATAKRIGYSGSVVTSVCKGAYGGDLGSVEAKVRGAFMGSVVNCPIMGEIPRDRCMNEQAKRHIGTSELRTALFHACRGGCEHSRLKVAGGVDG